MNIRRTYNNSAGVIFQTNFNKKLITKYFGNHKNSVIIHNGADLNYISDITPLQDKILDKYQDKRGFGDVNKAYEQMRVTLNKIYYKAINLTPEEKTEYDKLIVDLAEARTFDLASKASVPNNTWNVETIKKWMTEKDVKFTSKDKKADLLENISKLKGMKKKMEESLL